VQVCFDDTVSTSLAVAPASGTEGDTVNLSAKLTGAGVGLSGKTIDFTLNGNSVGSAVTTSDGTATLANVGLTGLTAGTYPGAVAASFAGDADDDPSGGTSALTVIGVPTVSSVVDDGATGSGWAGTEVAGATAEDAATVTGDGGTPTGTVTYTLYDNGTCSSPSAGTQTVALTAGVVPASSVTAALGAGSYSYQAAYSGDVNYTAATAKCETFAVATSPGSGSSAGSGSGSGSSGGTGSASHGSHAPVPFHVSRITVLPGGIVRFRLTVSRGGTVNVLETAWDNDLATVARVTLLDPAPHRFTFARVHVGLSGPKTILVTVKPNAKGGRLLAHHNYRVRIRLWVTFAAPGHRQGKKGYYGIPLTP
jgi:hypothetical protein